MASAYFPVGRPLIGRRFWPVYKTNLKKTGDAVFQPSARLPGEISRSPEGGYWQRERMAQVAPADSEQSELFGDNYAQPDAADGDPVLWSASSVWGFPPDAPFKFDATESV